ncbi:hypothetical protein ACFW2X_14950 [Streptomyces antibioticus]|uniref:hypothetical protein n=1 Tax=Streptomyces antibioticus TaxID=1890 RepID=UPI0036A35A43
MTGGELTLGTVLARLEECERETAELAEAAKERIAELSVQPEEFHRAADEIRITRKPLLEPPDPHPPAPPPP